MSTIPTFAPLPPADLSQGPNARKFIGDGSQILRVPGLRSVEKVTVDGILLPEVRELKYPSRDTPKNAEQITLDRAQTAMYALTQSDTGETILIRSELSNDGRWQKGSTIVVVGEWAENSERRLEEMTKQELLSLASAHQIEVDKSMTPVQIRMVLRDNGVGKEPAAA